MRSNSIRWSVGLLGVCLIASGMTFAANGEKGSWEVGVFAGAAFPDDYTITGTGTANPQDDVLFGARVGTFLTSLWSLEASYQHLSTRSSFGGTPSDVKVAFDAVRVNALVNFRPGAVTRPFLTFGIGNEEAKFGSLLDSSDIGFNAGGGLRWELGESFGMRLDARYIRINLDTPVDNSQDNIEATIGMHWSFGGGAPADTDGDGVPDRKDRCPDTPRGATVDDHGCPSDGDGDGVMDGLDRCPETPAGYAVDAEGCSSDKDGDGVNDVLDACPDTPTGAKVDARGCPMDSDGDGVFDGIDACPETPAGAKVDARGCSMDSDGDGVADGVDKCPDTPRGAKVDANGCPTDGDGDGVFDGIDKCPETTPGKKVDEKGCEILFAQERATLVLDNVNFELSSAELTAPSRKILDSVVQALVQSYADISLEVSGHTDSSGSAGYNQRLSQQRAESVRDYLASKGIGAERLTAKGYGESQPIADNATDEGSARNRRVELKRLN